MSHFLIIYLELLDGKEIKLFERQFLVRWKESREMKRKPKVYPGNSKYKFYLNSISFLLHKKKKMSEKLTRYKEIVS